MAGTGSASSSASSAVDASGGNLNINQPNYVMWAVIGVVALAVFFYFSKRK